jgi:hypothetical protein
MALVNHERCANAATAIRVTSDAASEKRRCRPARFALTADHLAKRVPGVIGRDARAAPFDEIKLSRDNRAFKQFL